MSGRRVGPSSSTDENEALMVGTNFKVGRKLGK